MPGSYIVNRYVDFSWRDSYNNGTSVVEVMQDHTSEIDKELTRKRTEFGMPVIPRDRFGRRTDLETNLNIGD